MVCRIIGKEWNGCHQSSSALKYICLTVSALQSRCADLPFSSSVARRKHDDVEEDERDAALATAASKAKYQTLTVCGGRANSCSTSVVCLHKHHRDYLATALKPRDMFPELMIHRFCEEVRWNNSFIEYALAAECCFRMQAQVAAKTAKHVVKRQMGTFHNHHWCHTEILFLNVLG